MATRLYIIFSLAFAAVAILFFELYLITSYLTVLFWFASLLGGMVLTFIIFVLFFWVYSFTIKEIDPHNMRNHGIVNSILQLAFRFLNVKLVVTGKENIPLKGEKFIFVCNHQENYDIMAIKPVLKEHPLNFIAKKESFDWFLLGRWIRMLGNVPIKRDADRDAAESIIRGIKLYKEGIPMAIFPEGKRTFGNELTHFKPGAFKLATKPKADILVGTIYDFSKVFKWWPIKRHKIYLHFHPLLKYETYQAMNTIELSQYVKQMIQTKLDEYKNIVK
ncbi:lysophospholipid acyltransferase family protein [Liberiplasma polymorphum]|uniref:lysophospholipid acyltransferase family protein n=1 Tax=Liberiplasma polymorphum TaxID=3374570 RepID=UPI0037728EA3